MRRCSIEITPTELHDELVSVHYEASLLSGVGSWVGGGSSCALMTSNRLLKVVFRYSLPSYTPSFSSLLSVAVVGTSYLLCYYTYLREPVVTRKATSLLHMYRYKNKIM